MHYAVMYKTAQGSEVLMKPIFRTLEDAESGVLESTPWLAEDGWERTRDGSRFHLSDGSEFVIFLED